MKKVIVWMLTLVMMLSMMTVPALADEKATLTVLVYVGAELAAQLEELAIPFEEANNCNVDVVMSPLDSYDQKLATMIAANEEADVFWVPEYSTPQYILDGMCMDLSEYMEDAEYDFADFIEGQQNHYLYDGKLWGVAFSGAPLVMFYNKDIFEAAGEKTPTELYEAGEWTVDAMIELAKKLTDAEKGIYGIDFTRQGDWANWDVVMNPVTRLYGGQPWSDDYTTVLMNSEETKKGFETFCKLMFEDKAHAMPGTIVDFKAGQLAMCPDLYNVMKNFGTVDFAWDVVPMPINEKGISTGWLGSAGYAVYSGTKKPDLAKAYVKYMTTKEMIDTLQFTYVPTRTSVIGGEAYKTGKDGAFVTANEKAFEYTIVKGFEGMAVKMPHPKYNNLSQIIKEYLDLAYAQAVSPSDALDMMAEEMDAFMVK